jgi:hypothetical protein
MCNTVHYDRTQCLFHHTIFKYQVKIRQLPQKNKIKTRNISPIFQVSFPYKIIYDCPEGSDKEVPIMFDDVLISHGGGAWHLNYGLVGSDTM